MHTIRSIGNGDNAKVVSGRRGFRAERLEEQRDVRAFVRLIQVVVDAYLVLARYFGGIVERSVQSPQASECGEADIARCGYCGGVVCLNMSAALPIPIWIAAYAVVSMCAIQVFAGMLPPRH